MDLAHTADWNKIDRESVEFLVVLSPEERGKENTKKTMIQKEDLLPSISEVVKKDKGKGNFFSRR